MGVEIERKWLLDTVSGSVCKFAFKTCGTLSRIEIEKYITAGVLSRVFT